MLWRRMAAGLLVSVLGVMPSAAIVCAVSCVGDTTVTMTAAADAHAHHRASVHQHQASDDVALRAASHDCVEHAGVPEMTATVRRIMPSAAPDAPVAALHAQALRHSVAATSGQAQPSPGPPGYTLSLAPPVLRI